MQTIHKFGPFSQAREFVLTDVTRVVHFGEQNGGLYVWALVNLEPHKPKERTFCIVGTGWNFEHDFKHVQTVQDSEGFVWHLLQVRNFAEEAAERIFPVF